MNSTRWWLDPADPLRHRCGSPKTTEPPSEYHQGGPINLVGHLIGQFDVYFSKELVGEGAADYHYPLRPKVQVHRRRRTGSWPSRVTSRHPGKFDDTDPLERAVLADGHHRANIRRPSRTP